MDYSLVILEKGGANLKMVNSKNSKKAFLRI